MIRRLSVKNWRSHLDNQLDFDKGTNVLVGPMGSGKSSLMDAMCFALFGTFPALVAKKIRLDEILLDKKNVTESTVTIEFDSDGQTYQVSRVVERGKGNTKSEIRQNGALVEGPQSQRVTEVVEKKLGIDYDLFYRAVYGEQNEIDYFLKLAKGKRKEQLDELLKLERFEEARKNSVWINNRLYDSLQEKRSLVKTLKEQGEENQLQKIEDEITSLREKNLETQNRLQTGKKDAEELRKEILALEKEEQKVLEIRSKKETLLGQIKQLREQTKHINFDEYSEEALREEKNKLEKNRAEANLLRENLGETEAKISFISKEKLAEADKILEEKQILEQQVQEITSENPDPPEKLSQTRQNIEETNNALSEAKARRQELLEAIQGLQRSEKQCPTCGNYLSPDKKTFLVREKREKLKELAEIIEEKEKKLETLKQKLPLLNEQEKNLIVAKQRLEQIKTVDKKSLENEIEELEKKEISQELMLKEKQKQVAETEQKVKKLEKIQEAKNLQLRAQTLQEALDGLNLSLETISHDPEKIKTLRNRYETVIRTNEKLSSKQTHCEEMIREKQERKKQLLETVAKIREKELEIQKLSQSAEFLAKLKQGLRQTQTLLRQEFLSSINQALPKVWETLYPYSDYTSVSLQAEQDDYYLVLERNDGKKISVGAVTSGGERALSSLALRIALAVVLTHKLSWIVLDEPTHNLDKKSVQELATALREHLPKVVEQIFLITHEEELENAANAYVYRLHRDKQKNAPTAILQEKP